MPRKRCAAAGRIGPPIDPGSDPNATGLIGLENSPITTSVGRLEAKRTTTEPLMARAQTRYYVREVARQQDIMPFAFMAVFLLFKPYGLWGWERIERV